MDKTKKIGYLITKGNWGGAQKYVYNLATNLPKSDFDVFVICGSGGTLKKRLEEAGVKTYELADLKRDISIFSEIKSLWQIFKIIKKEKPDVIHLNSPKASGIGGLVGRILGVKNIIMTVHGFTFNEDRGFFSKNLIRFFSWVTILLCHKTIVIDEKEKNQSESMMLVSEEKIKLVKNGIEKIKFLEKDIARETLLPNIYENYKDCISIGTIGELHKNKGVDFLVEALSKIEKPYICTVIGDGEEKKNIENLIQKHRLEEKVFLVGQKENASSLLPAFDIFTLTSRKEGLPYVLLESGLASIPTIASDIGGIPDIIDNGTNGLLVQKGNVEQIKNAIERLIEYREEREALGRNLKEKIEKEFSLEEMLEKTISLY